MKHVDPCQVCGGEVFVSGNRWCCHECGAEWTLGMCPARQGIRRNSHLDSVFGAGEGRPALLAMRRASEELAQHDCPGLAQELSRIVQRMMLQAGIAERGACPACGEYAGRHAPGCIDEFEQAEPELDQDVWGDL